MLFITRIRNKINEIIFVYKRVVGLVSKKNILSECI